MINVLVVDDEPVVRQGISQAINWSDFGVCIVGEAENANEAISQANRLHPDIILCDIKMPDETGFKVIETLQKTLPGVQFILLSGYSDQEFMLNAIRFGVRDYILKPASMAEIREAVLKVCRELFIKQQEDQRNRQESYLLRENLDNLRVLFMDKLLHNSISEKQLQESAKSFNIPFTGPKYLLLLFRSKLIWEYMQNLSFIFKDFLPVITPHSSECVISVILNLNSDPTDEFFSSISNRFSASSQNLEGIVAVSPIVDSPLAFHKYFPKLKMLIERGFWYPKGMFCSLENADFMPYPQNEVHDFERQIIESLKEGQITAAVQYFDSLLELFSSVKPPLSVFQEEIKLLFQSIQILYNDHNQQIEEVAATVDEIRHQFQKICNESFSIANKYGKGLVGKALHYIEQHYSEELSLKRVSSELFISPTYLSHILKEKTSYGFGRWVHYCRIQKAKELLVKTKFTSYRIAELVGYSSYKLFSEHFRKMVGTTASEYRLGNLNISDMENNETNN